MPPLGWEKRARRLGNARGAWGGASRLMAERLGLRGMGVAAQLAVNFKTAPFKRNSAFGDHPYSLGIGPSSFVAPAAIASN
jgi:hypothetical protein